MEDPQSKRWNYDDIIKFRIGAKVQKVGDYKYPGIVVCVFRTTERKVQYVVEADHPDFKGMLHIYANKDLEERE
jgi:hypothetical protein